MFKIKKFLGTLVVSMQIHVYYVLCMPIEFLCVLVCGVADTAKNENAHE